MGNRIGMGEEGQLSFFWLSLWSALQSKSGSVIMQPFTQYLLDALRMLWCASRARSINDLSRSSCPGGE